MEDRAELVFPFMLWDDESILSVRKKTEQICWKFDSSIADKKNRRGSDSWVNNEAILDDRATSPSTIDSGFDSGSFDTSLNNSTDWNPKSPTSALPEASSGSTLCLQFTEMYDFLNRFEKSEFDGVDSPKRLFNRKSSFQYIVDDKSDSSIVSLAKKSSLSTSAKEFVPSNYFKSSIKNKASSWSSFNFDIFDFPRMMTSQIPHEVASFSIQSQNQYPFFTSTPVKIRRKHPYTGSTGSVCCVYCKRAGYDVSIYQTHCLRNPMTKTIICPILLENLCKVCGSKAEDWLIHTSDECKKSSSFNHINLQMDFQSED